MKSLALSFVLALSATSGICFAQGDNAQTPPISPTPDVLQSPRQIETEQRQLQGRVYESFKKLQKQPIGKLHNFEGEFAATLVLIGRLHIENFAPQLLDVLDFELDPSTVGLGACPLSYEFYPAAKAYAKIANKQDIDALFAKIALPQTEKMLAIVTWILGEVHGQELATLEVQSKLEAEDVRLVELKETSSTYKTNLEHIEALLKSKNYLIAIPLPTKKQSAVPAIPPR